MHDILLFRWTETDGRKRKNGDERTETDGRMLTFCVSNVASDAQFKREAGSNARLVQSMELVRKSSC